jgi:hypothetical protein
MRRACHGPTPEGEGDKEEVDAAIMQEPCATAYVRHDAPSGPRAPSQLQFDHFLVFG